MLVGTAPSRASTTYISMLYEAVERAGATVDDITLRKLLRRRYDIVHLHWPEWYLYRRPRARMVARSTAFLGALAWARLRGARVVWTVHNLSPHEQTPRRFSRWYFAVFTRLVDAVVSLTRSGIGPLRRKFPHLSDAATAVIPLGQLRGHYPDHGGRLVARERLGISPEATVATFFGHVRPYKNVLRLVHEFRALADASCVLLIAGRPLDERMRAEVEAAADGDARIHLHLGFVEDDDVQHFMRAADLVVLPYADSSNSSVALLALSFDLPLLAPRLGGFVELATTVGPEWVRLYEGDLTAAVLRDALTSARHTKPDVASPNLDAYSWARIGTDTVSLYRAVVRRRPD